MIIQNVRIDNWKSYKGEHNFNFETSGNKNSTLILAVNGVGKTAFLRAIKWAITGQFASDDNPRESSAVNNQAIRETPKGEKCTCVVRLEFTHNKVSYVLERRGSYTISDQTEETYQTWREDSPDLLVLKDIGEYEPVANPDKTLGTILPRSLIDFFLCEGERLEGMRTNSASDTIKREVEEFFNLRRAKDLQKIAEQARRFIATKRGKISDQKTAELVNKINDLNDSIEKSYEAKRDLSSQISRLKASIESINEQLETFKEIEGLLKLLDEKRSKKKIFEEAILACKEQRRVLLNNEGHKLLLESKVPSFLEATKELKVSGKLPALFKDSFVNKLLEDQLCICGASLCPDLNSGAREKVKALLEQAGSSGFEEGVQRLLHEIRIAFSEGTLDSARQQISDLKDKCHQAESDLEEIDKEIEVLEEKKGHTSNTEITGLKQKLDRDMAELERLSKDLGVKENTIRINEEERKDLKSRYDKVKGKKKEERELAAADECVTELITYLELRRETDWLKIRHFLEKETTKFFNRVTGKTSVIRFDNDLNIRKYETSKPDSLRLQPSQGEGVLIAAAVVRTVIEALKAQPESDSEYTVIIDAPFSKLSELATRDVSESLPEVAAQIIFTVLDKDYKSLSSTFLSGLGTRYLLQNRVPGIVNETTEFFDEDGTKHQSVVQWEESFSCPHIISLGRDPNV